ncbi:hypothetical protein [Vibrio salinus]|uniref:hypothetical protein n=1 Tax=Vibrio salinus TaxID=2899784 RepID=UPI001E438771|nr:hypothetical protein [Vibrio salinus]MCE0493881.1 hypothetical protein [Vibrio salinus]
MYKGFWYDAMGKERFDLRPMSLNFDELRMAVDEVLNVLPDATLVNINENLDWALISLENTKRMLICKN